MAKSGTKKVNSRNLDHSDKNDNRDELIRKQHAHLHEAFNLLRQCEETFMQIGDNIKIEVIRKCKEQLMVVINSMAEIPLNEAGHLKSDTPPLHPARKQFIEMSHNFEGKKVLVVEDDNTNYAYLHEILSQTSLDFLRAKDGLEALKITDSYNPDLIIMDIRLPFMNGLDVTKKIRESGIKTPVIAQTAYAMSEDKEKCLAAGCDDYISKPIHKELLLKKIAYHLHKTENLSGIRSTR